jgi:acetyl esterase/lipase
MISFKARFFIFLLKATKRKQVFLDAAAFNAAISARRKTQSHAPNDKIRARLDIEERSLDGSPVYVVKPQGGKAPAHFLYYMHGGAYTFEIIPQHWAYVADMAEVLNAQIMVPIYPLAPEHKAEQMLAFAHKAYRDFEENHAGGAPIHMVGDSAGAAMLVAMAQQMVAAGKTLPKSLMLISPFLEVDLSGPEIDAIDKIDPWLSPPGLKEAGRLYAGDLALTDPIVSPARGAVEGLPPVHIFIGTRDILLPSAKAFADKITAAGGKASYRQYEGMFHVWPAAQCREGREVLDEIQEIIASG